jgi:peroxiredoxin
MKKIMIICISLWCTLGVQAQLPSVTIKNIRGQYVNTNSLNNNGLPYVISFFGLWCKPCLRELEAIHEVYADWQAETGMKLIIVSVDEAQNAYKVAPAIKGYGWDYEVLLDSNKEFLRAMNTNTVPAVFVIDGKNNIVLRQSAYVENSEEKLINKIRELIAK